MSFFLSSLERVLSHFVWFLIFIRVRRQTAYLFFAAADAAADSDFAENESICFAKPQNKKMSPIFKVFIKKIKRFSFTFWIFFLTLSFL